jgi:hypothetical protein
METSKTLRISLNYSAAESFIAELKGNNIPFFYISPTAFVLENSPKSRMAIKLTKERFGSTCIRVTEVENC